MLFFKPNIKRIITRKDVSGLKKMLAKGDIDVWKSLRFGPVALTPLLIECLSDDDAADSAAGLLVEINHHFGKVDSCINPILPQIVRALHHENEGVRTRSSIVLTHCLLTRRSAPEFNYSYDLLQQLLRRRESEKPEVKRAAGALVRSLTRQRDPVPVLIDALERCQRMPKRRGTSSELGEFREWIVSILGGFGPEERIVSALTRSLREEKGTDVRHVIRKILEEFGPVSGSIP